MSKFEEKTLACPQCGREFTADIATSLNVSNKPQFRAAILDGSFQSFTCEECNTAFLVDHPLMYIDFDRKLWIALFPEAWEPSWHQYEAAPRENFNKYMTGEFASPYAREMAGGFVIRSVFGLPALAEKIRCLEARLDDSLLAILKLQMMQSIDGLMFNPSSRPRLVEIEEEQLKFSARTVDEKDETQREMFVVPRDALDYIAGSRDQYEPLLKLLGEGPYVDVGRIMFAREDQS